MRSSNVLFVHRKDSLDLLDGLVQYDALNSVTFEKVDSLPHESLQHSALVAEGLPYEIAVKNDSQVFEVSVDYRKVGKKGGVEENKPLKHLTEYLRKDRIGMHSITDEPGNDSQFLCLGSISRSWARVSVNEHPNLLMLKELKEQVEGLGFILDRECVLPRVISQLLSKLPLARLDPRLHALKVAMRQRFGRIPPVATYFSNEELL